MAIFFHRSKTKAFLAFLAGVKTRWGYQAPLRRAWLTDPCPIPTKRLHKIDLFLNLVKHFGIEPDGRSMDFYPDARAEDHLNELLGRQGVEPGEPYALIHAGGNWELKRWPAGHFVRFIKIFLEKHRIKVILCGTRSEETLSRNILGSFTDGRVVSLCGKTSLDELGLLVKNARFLLSNDSGPIHLAASQKTNIIGLFGPTSPEETGPVSLGNVTILKKDVGCAIPCYFRSCDTRVCMELLAPEEVADAAAKFVT